MPVRTLPTPKLSYVLGPAIIVALGSITVASAQSPFANKKKQQAWETPQAPSAAPVRQTQPKGKRTYYPAPSQSGSPVPPTQYSSPNMQPKIYGGDVSSTTATSPMPSSKVTAPTQTHSSGTYNYQGPSTQPSETQMPVLAGQPYPPNHAARSGYKPSPYPHQNQAQATYPNQPYPPQGHYNQRRSWKQKLGLSNLATSFKGFFKGGAAAVHRDDGVNSNWSEDFIADAKVEFEVSAVTDSGYEYGVNLQGRAQYDKYRRGFGVRVNDCPPNQAGCSTATIAGNPTSLRGHTSRFYSAGANDAKDTEYALESAHLFLRTSYGDVTLGRDDGAAYLFSLGAPSLLAVNASNSPVDYTGLDSVKTVNDASGFSEKITYTSPRLLGDTVGVGVQFGASYAPNARACGVDYCVKRTDVLGTQSPDLKNIIEAGLSLDRTFRNGMKVEATASYAMGSERSNLVAFDDLKAFNIGAELSWMDITLGGSYLDSNNGLANGDYKAWDIGATWKPSALGFTLGYGHAKDDNVNLSSDQFVAGVSYDFNKFTLGAGAQFIEREVQAFNGATVLPQKDKATALFVEGGFKF